MTFGTLSARIAPVHQGGTRQTSNLAMQPDSPIRADFELAVIWRYSPCNARTGTSRSREDYGNDHDGPAANDSQALHGAAALSRAWRRDHGSRSARPDR